MQVCTGKNRDGSNCQHSVANKMRENDCLCHPSAPLQLSGKCPIYFIYIRPKDNNDKRRWLAVMERLDNGIPSHNHPKPIESKLNAVVLTDLQAALHSNPSYTANDLSKGRGMPYTPAAVSLAATNPASFSNTVNRLRRGVTAGRTAQYIIENFDTVVKNPIEERNNKYIEDEDIRSEMKNLCDKYIRLVLLTTIIQCC